MTQKNKTTDAASGIAFDKPAIKTALLFFRAISQKDRQKILQLLLTHGPLRVAELLKKTRMNTAIMSQYLTILKQADIVVCEREGRSFRYKISSTVNPKLYDYLKKN